MDSGECLCRRAKIGEVIDIREIVSLYILLLYFKRGSLRISILISMLYFCSIKAPRVEPGP